MSIDENTQKRFLLNQAAIDRSGSRRAVMPVKQSQPIKPVLADANPPPKPTSQPATPPKTAGGCSSCSRRKGK